MLSRLRSHPTAERFLFAVVLLVIAVQAVVIANRRATHGGDFDVSREFGRRLLAGEALYAGGLHYPYMPTAALYFAPLALLPPGVGLALRYGVALLCLWLTLRLLHRMATARDPGLAAQPVALAAITLGLASHFVLRDLDDGGPHLILLGMLVGGVYSVWRGRGFAAALWLGLAAALKAPNALVLPFLLWKRQWRLAALTAAALIAWTVLPAVWMGPASWWQHQQQWLAAAVASARGAPSGLAQQSEERLQNQALRPVVARYRAAAASGDGAADRAPALAIGALLALAAWWTRPRAPSDFRATWPVESSAVLILSVLLSPVAWVQHFVVAIPALYLIVAAQRGRAGLSAPATAAMAAYVVLTLLLNRELLGRAAYLILLGHGLHTAGMLLILAVLALIAPRAADQSAVKS